ncbi:MAG: nucleotidyltransferase family protein [Sphingomonas paucimobilis]
MNAAAQVIELLRADPLRWHLLGLVRDLDLRDGWIGAGFVRNAVWDQLHGRTASPPTGDVDVLWHDPRRPDATEDRRLEAMLRAVGPDVAWSVKNQARMHLRNGDAPYASVADAMRCWPETATAVAVRRIGETGCEVTAPFGLDDLMRSILRPTPRFVGDKRSIYAERVRSKDWLTIWPGLREVVDHGT